MIIMMLTTYKCVLCVCDYATLCLGYADLLGFLVQAQLENEINSHQA